MRFLSFGFHCSDRIRNTIARKEMGVGVNMPKEDEAELEVTSRYDN